MRLAFALALVAFSACSLAEEDASVQVVVSLPVGSPAGLDAAVSVGRRPVPLDAVPQRGGFAATAGPVAVRPGRSTVACAITDGSASTTGTLALDLTPGFTYDVACAVAAEDPADRCFGCQGSEAVALDPALGFDDGLSLYLVWSETDPDNVVLY